MSSVAGEVLEGQREATAVQGLTVLLEPCRLEEEVEGGPLRVPTPGMTQESPPALGALEPGSVSQHGHLPAARVTSLLALGFC